MLIWPYCRDINQRSHGDVNIGTVSNNGVRRADPVLPCEAALQGRSEVRARHLLQCRQRQPGMDAARHVAVRTCHSSADRAQHRRRSLRPQHPMEILRRQLQRLRDRRCIRRHLLQHLQSVRV
jgi:hypothetical protein